MKIVIAGGSGFLGQALKSYFTQKGAQVFILTRTPQKSGDVYWDAKNPGAWQQTLEQADVLINMTGKSVDCRYTEVNKHAIYQSRIDSTTLLQQSIETCTQPPKVWLNASSATIYVHAETQQMTEGSGIIGDDFSMNICKSWEASFFKETSVPVRKVALRTAIVLGNEGGAFPKFKQITRFGLGGQQGRGQQMMSWIHIEDFCRAVDFIMQHEEISGAINVTAPNPIPNRSFMQHLQKRMGIPFGIPSPAALLELAAMLIGTETELMLKSRNVLPERLQQYGFSFNYPDLSAALKQLI
ncbi:TIGR01777 family protein [Taibaiella sp. KBW10]|uniref:TIGR01777 family oxidoreductase n=1 Tax=Taibaiella sp. KBW10 TaxID=2153357 RepID=UPI000F5B2E1E|nr:TIGR01777 family oxidoreductase [Taibaiella sp. KBW10]RQO32194.1 TIGR01777 family protein [Taibaiella sp. KBW10]